MALSISMNLVFLHSALYKEIVIVVEPYLVVLKAFFWLLGITPGKKKNPYGVLRIKIRSTLCKVSVLLYLYLSSLILFLFTTSLLGI